MSNSIEEKLNVTACDRMAVNLENAGNFISSGTAEAYLKEYFQTERIPDPSDEGLIYGHTFGLNKLKTLLANIDKYNDTAAQNEDIKGIRIYYAYSQRNDADFPLDPKDGCFKDLFILPVKCDGTDFYDVKDEVSLNDKSARGEEFILGESRPCPNQCGLTLYEQKKKNYI
ncbi:hypothetical protein [Pedobacter nototheniae]|uniref:hypothetical protein n=1 Tax=Pedobacter nototheniae TaxID=2488994 RepID=UPI001039F04C|nr:MULTISPECIES: hypothetical protein [Pedobacter]